MHSETDYQIGYVDGQQAAARRLDITKKDGRYVSGATRAAGYARVCAGEEAEESVRNRGA